MTLAEAYAHRAVKLQSMQNMGKICQNLMTPQREKALKRARAAYQKADAEFRKLATQEALS